MNKYKKAFTLVELIVVITILAILGTIAFISLQGYTREARDTKRLSDVNNIYKKILLERIKGAYPSNMMSSGVFITSGLTLGGIMPMEAKQGKVNFLTIKEEENSFKDPKGNDYVLSYGIGGNGTGAYKFLQLATVNESKNEAVLVGDYYKLLSGDSSSIVFSDATNTGSELVEDKKSILPYQLLGNNGGGGNPIINISFIGSGTSASPWKLDSGTIASCQDYNLNAIKTVTNTTRGSGICGDGTKECFPNGIYTIDPDGAGGNPEFPVYCNMNTDKGGWTLILKWTIMPNDTYSFNRVCGTSLNYYTYTNDTSNFPVFLNDRSNFGSECLYIGGNTLWNNKFGWVKFNKGGPQSSAIALGVGFDGISEKLGTYKFGTFNNGWYGTMFLSDPFSIWETYTGNGGMCGGASACGSQACPGTRSDVLTCHIDQSSQKYIYVR